MVAVQVRNKDAGDLIRADARPVQLVHELAADAAHRLERPLPQAGVYQHGLPAGAEGKEAHLEWQLAVRRHGVLVGVP